MVGHVNLLITFRIYKSGIINSDNTAASRENICLYYLGRTEIPWNIVSYFCKCQFYYSQREYKVVELLSETHRFLPFISG